MTKMFTILNLIIACVSVLQFYPMCGRAVFHIKCVVWKSVGSDEK